MYCGRKPSGIRIFTHLFALSRTSGAVAHRSCPDSVRFRLNEIAHHEQNQNVCALQQGRIRDVPRPNQAGEDMVLLVQALRRRGEGGQPLLPVRRHVKRVAEVGVDQVTVFFVFGCLPKCP